MSDEQWQRDRKRDRDLLEPNGLRVVQTMTRAERHELRRLKTELKTERRLVAELTQALFARRRSYRLSAPRMSRLMARIRSR